jgi:hypothetical protein
LVIQAEPVAASLPEWLACPMAWADQVPEFDAGKVSEIAGVSAWLPPAQMMGQERGQVCLPPMQWP